MDLSKLSFDELVDLIAGRSNELELFVLLLICGRIKEIGETGPLTAKQKEQDLKKILDKAHRTSVLQRAEANRVLEMVLNKAYFDSKYLFEYRNLPFIPLKENKPLFGLLNAFKREVLTDPAFRTQAFMLRDPANRKKLIPTSLSKAYNDIINEAAEAATNGIGNYTDSIRKTLKDMLNSGIRHVWYDPESGRVYSQSADAAVKRNILDNIRDINQKAQDELGKQYGADGKEITVHEHAAPDHEPFQGHQFTNEEWEKLQNNQNFKDVKGRKFEAVKRRIGIWNCRHFAYSIIIGVNKPNFTDEQLQENIDRNHQGYTDKDGNHMTLYECSQEQRRLERLIRNDKRNLVCAKEAGDLELAKEYQKEINTYSAEYHQFCEACGLPEHPENMRVAGYRKIKI